MGNVSTDFLLTSMIVILLPGTGVLYTLAWGLGRGFGVSIVAASGCTLGILPHIAVSVGGLAALIHTHPAVFQTVKYAGVVYLLYMAWSVARDNGPLQVNEKTSSINQGRILAEGFLINILNPKLSLFFLAFLPQFVPVNSGAPAPVMLQLGAIFMVLTFLVFAGYGYFAALARTYVIMRPNVLLWLRYAFAAAFALLAMRLALAG